ncbi:uncharacterized membrane protein (DUF485 family) [Streptomyces sp. B3I7]|uniref:DUF485 domain-containing protein n=1 Tax=Streptomyces sp. B3I7 TaxID=3042269 RepID=UPI002789F11E|nr:DUF485 domain-containing protein [Streptomyces sp. B3I7]MDQ0810730.1 uncharacterized membrane protein (DUF485 family) [Streptomyces sp. B3I7]
MQSRNDRSPVVGGTAEDLPENHAPHDPVPPGGGREPAAGYDDPWYDALAAGWGEADGAGLTARAVPAPRRERERGVAEVYLEVRSSAAFQEVRRRYRRFVIPGAVVFLTWYVGYVVAATSAPGLMARPVAGAVNVAMLAGLGQFLSTFLLTWAYARHARLRRDRAALDLRWSTQELTRSSGGGRR